MTDQENEPPRATVTLGVVDESEPLYRLLKALCPRRDDLPPTLSHYTSPDGLIGILTSKKLWASDTSCLNDASELKHASKLVEQAFKEVCADLSEDRKKWFRIGLQVAGGDVTSMPATVVSNPINRPAVSCFCAEGDDLGQWRGYGSGGEGFSIQFPSASLSLRRSIGGTPFILHKVFYEEEVQIRLIQEYLSGQKARNGDEKEPLAWFDCAFRLASVMPLFKHPKFEMENEWRLVNHPSYCVGLASSEWKFRHSGRRIVPYVETDLTACLIGSVTMGPFSPDENAQAIRAMLEVNGWGKDIPVLPSRIPLR